MEPKPKIFLDMFAESVRNFPDAIAVKQDATTLTYSKLNELSDAVAENLVSEKIEPGQVVACFQERSVDLIVSFLAILKAGAIYLPLDTTLPTERLSYMIEDAKPTLIITSSENLLTLEQCGLNLLFKASAIEHLKAPKVSTGRDIPKVPGSNAYVIYTSGSTGKPKGVLVSHKALANHLSWQLNTFNFNEKDKVLQNSALSFDPSIWEILVPLSCGARLILGSTRAHLDPDMIHKLLLDEQISVVSLVPSVMRLVLEIGIADCHSLKTVFSGGEALTLELAKKFLSQSQAALYNVYGPTEATIISTFWKCPKDPTEISIGKPITNSDAHVLNEQLEDVEIGELGELCMSGILLAEGYLNKPVESENKFISRYGKRIYRTGDLVYQDELGQLFYQGRIDDQLKIRGIRVESGEIEGTIQSLDRVKRCIVKVEQHPQLGDELVAYIKLEDDAKLENQIIRQELERKLPLAIIPQRYIQVSEFPLSPSGKVDKKQLQPNYAPPTVDSKEEEHSNAVGTHGLIHRIWQKILSLSTIHDDDNFFDLGGTSLLAHKLSRAINKQLGWQLSAADIFENPTIKRLLNSHLKRPNYDAKDRAPRISESKNHDVAVIGMAGKFPGAKDIQTFWENLCTGKDCISDFDFSELDESIPYDLFQNPDYVKSRGIVSEAKCFDAGFFGFNRKEAAVMDPQQRVFLETCWHAIEDAGILIEEGNRVGVFGGTGNNTYYLTNVQPGAGTDGGIGETLRSTLSEKDYVATRVAYKLGLEGPAISVNTACSTSLVAIVMACESLRSGSSNIALAGGCSINTPINSGYVYQPGSMLSPDGRTRPFDEQAAGTSFNSGAGVVVLKPLEQAKSDNDRIYAVIKGIGLNNDGADKASFTAPSIRGQKLAVQGALDDAAVDARSINFIEAHGTGTPIGDPIEIKALAKAYSERSQSTEKQYCVVGSLKSNVGHMVAAAGVGGVIKTALALHNRLLPPTAHFQSPNKDIDFENSPFYVSNKMMTLEGKTLRAGVSSFGVGGTNAHTILENHFVENEPEAQCNEGTSIQVMLYSGRDEDAPTRLAESIENHLAKETASILEQAAFTLQTKRLHHNFRNFSIASTNGSTLEILGRGKTNEAPLLAQTKSIAFMFPGQGVQHAGMSRALYNRFPRFAAHIDECINLLPSGTSATIRQLLLDAPSESSTETIKQTQYAQITIFIHEYCLARWWIELGILPGALIGHSIGEFVAATLAGIFSLADGLKLVSERGRLMQAMPAGAMLSVRQPWEETRAMLSDSLDLAVVNGSNLAVASGPFDEIERLEKKLSLKKIPAKRLQTSHAFHSPMMEPAVRPFREVLENIDLNTPTIPIMSTANADWLNNEEALDVDYWANHLRKTVRFSEGVLKLAESDGYLLLESGPLNATSSIAKQVLKNTNTRVISSCNANPEPENLIADEHAFFKALGELWQNGLQLNWQAIHGRSMRVASLPPYPFKREEHWIEPNPGKQTSSDVAKASLFKVDSNKITSTIARTLSAGQDTMNTKAALVTQLKNLFADCSGEELEQVDPATSFLELGFDSLLLTQVDLSLKNTFKTEIGFRKLMGELDNFDTLADYLESNAPTEALPSSESTNTGILDTNASAEQFITSMDLVNTSGAKPAESSVQKLIESQLEIMRMQLQALDGGAIASQHQNDGLYSSSRAKGDIEECKEAGTTETPKLVHSRSIKINKEIVGANLSKAQQAWIEETMQAYQKHFASSKAYAQKHRKYFADPRTVSGFSPEWKEITFPIVTNRSSGSKITDIDDNELIDVTNGFGPIFFGHSPEFINQELKNQLDQGIETGPQSELAGDVAKMICDITGNERCTYACTGSEAVLGALRIARTVSGKNKVVMFEGGYHGITDEVLCRPGPKSAAYPASPGIPRESTSNMIVLPWGDASSIETIDSLGAELAAVLVEPVQSRMPEFHDADYIRAIREVTTKHNVAMILDEVVTGFRVAPGGIRERFDIDSDLSTYGKVLGGGLSIGIIAGKAKYMDALDGGFWEYGDDSMPPSGVTYFAGTFVRHPLCLAAANAVLKRIQALGPELYEEMDAKTSQMCAAARKFIAEMKSDIIFEEFSSIFKIAVPENNHWGHMLFLLMRMDGIHIQHNRANFLTTAHDQKDTDTILNAFKKALAKLITIGLIEGDMVAAKKFLDNKTSIPKGARLGKNAQGEAAYFIEDPENNGQYIEVGRP